VKENESTAELKTDDNIPLKSNASLFIDRTKDMMEAQENVVHELAEKNGGKKGAENLVEEIGICKLKAKWERLSIAELRAILHDLSTAQKS
jgi:hypothetical protein